MFEQERYLGKVIRMLRRQRNKCRVLKVCGRVKVRACYIQEGYLSTAFARRVYADLIPCKNVRGRQAKHGPERF